MPGYSSVPVVSPYSTVPVLYNDTNPLVNTTSEKTEEENRQKIVNSIIVQIVGRPYQLVPMPEQNTSIKPPLKRGGKSCKALRKKHKTRTLRKSRK